MADEMEASREMINSATSANRASQPALLFHVVAQRERDEPRRKLKFYYCVIEDRRLQQFLGHPQEKVVTFPEAMEHHRDRMGNGILCGMEAIKEKVVFWIGHPGMTFTCIMNISDHNNFDWVFRDLDTSVIRRAFVLEGPTREFQMEGVITTTVGNRFIFLLSGTYYEYLQRTCLFSFDGNTERWSVFPECPDMIFDDCTCVSWKDKLYLYKPASLSPQIADYPVFKNFDFTTITWSYQLSSLVNPTFSKRLLELPRSCLESVQGRFLISSRSGTLYAIFADAKLRNKYSSIPVYALDDLIRSKWVKVSLCQSAHITIRHRNPFPPPNLACQICGSFYKGFHLIKFWEMGERDILLLIVQFHPICMNRLRYRWWIFNKDEGVKSYSSEELPVEITGKNEPYSEIQVLVAKME